jgi:hypothetical protein
MPEMKPPSGLGRRGFLQLFGGVIASAAVTPVASVVLSDDLYVNRRLGLAFTKPAGWAYESLKTFTDLRDEYELASVDPDLEKELKTGQLPIAVVSQSPVRTTLGASFTVYVEEHSFESDETLLGSFPSLVGYFQQLFRGFEVTSDPVLKRVSGYDSIDYTSRFIFQDSRGSLGYVRHRSLVTVRTPLLYTFNMLDIPSKEIDVARTFDQLVESIKYV